MISIKKLIVADIEMNDIAFRNVEDAIKLINALRKDVETKESEENTLGNIDEVKENVEETKVEVEETQKIIEEITINDIEVKFNQSELAEITKKKYFGAIKRIVSWFGLKVDDLFKHKVDNIIESIEFRYPNKNSRNLYLSSVMSVYKFYGITDLYEKVYSVFKNKTETKPVEEPIEEVIEEVIEEPKPIEEAHEIMNTIQSKYEELKSNIQMNMTKIECTVLLDAYS